MTAFIQIRFLIARGVLQVRAHGMIVGAFLFLNAAALSEPLATLDYRIAGTELRVSPPALSVPKGVPGSIRVDLASGGSTNAAVPSALAGDAFVEATLRGPSFPARRVIGPVNAPLLLPLLPLVGDYELNDIRLVDAATGATRMEGVPNRVPIRVFDEVLVSRVTSRPLTLDEIREKGIAIDDRNFRAVEFEIGFVLDGKTIPVRFPVVSPAFQGNTEIIPAAELERRLAEAEAINNQIDLGSVLPPELETARLNIDIKGINFQFTEESDQDLALSIPPIPALMVVPGNIGFLNQFFSVQIFTENGAPQDSGLSVVNVQALLKLPPGPDQVVSTNYSQPGDDPLRFARVGPDKVIQPVQPVVRAGADGRIGTADDIPRLFPGESGTGEFLVEGLQEGLHVMDLELTADLEGLAAGVVRIKGKAAGSVLVRNPKFSLAFSHPRTVRTGEPYDLYVSVLNTSSGPANLVQVAMAAASISGGLLESEELVQLGTILPGQTLTAKFRIRSTRTGAISFSNLTTSDDSVVGRFRLRGGVDERGVALSPDTIGMPGFVTNLPPALVDAANRVLGQALSVATAGQLPPNVQPVGKSVVTGRVLELAEAGQRVQYGDALPRVFADLLLDWQGARSFNAGFDQIIRETEAGREWREAVARHQEEADGLNAVSRLEDRLPDLAGRGEAWALVAVNTETGAIRFGDGTDDRIPAATGLAPRYDHTNSPSGLWFVTRPGTNLVFEWQPGAAVPGTELALALIDPNGTARRLRWTVPALPATACVRFDLRDPAARLIIDNTCDGVGDAAVTPGISTVNELPPALISVRQDPDVLAGRPPKVCSTVPSFPLNYGTVLAVLFSKPMTQDRVNVPEAYTLENGNVAGSVQIQPGGRVALLNMRRPVGALRPRSMTVSGVTDPRGQALLNQTQPVISDLITGASVRGRVARADGSPASGLPVTLTYYDQLSVGLSCEEFIVRPAQVFTDENGYFDFDLVISGIPYSVSATDTAGLGPEAIAMILESTRADEFQRAKLLELASSPGARDTLLADFAVGAVADVIARAEGLDRALLRDIIPSGSAREGTEVPVALRFRGRGAVAGRVVAADGVTPVPRVAVNLFPDPASRELGRGVFSDGDGRFAFFGVPLGIYSVQADSGAGLSRTVAGVIDQPGQTTNVLVVLSSAPLTFTDLTGRVTENDNFTPHAGATVFVGNLDEQGRFCCVVAAPVTDADGFWRAEGIPTDTYVLMAVSQDGRRKGERRNVHAPSGVTSFASIALQGFGVVIGRVETATGIPIVNAIVAGGEQPVRTTGNGAFRLTGVPTGSREIAAGVERSQPGQPPRSTPAFSFPRLGSARVNVLPGIENFAVIRLDSKGTLVGRVVDETGTNAVTGINVALPEPGGFQWVPVNSRGEFAFEGIALKKYTISAPAPAVSATDVTGILDTLSDSESSIGQLQAAIGEAFAIFTGAADPLLNGDGANFNPSRWGFTEVDLTADGEVRNVTVQFLRSSTIAGTVINGQGVPIGARVRLTGVGPALNGAPTTVIRGELNSDPALGTFSFPRQAFIGSYGLQAASPFFPIVLVTNGFTSEIQPDDTNVVLRFPATRDINGRLAGFVLNPDGSPAEPDVTVRIRSIDLEIRTRANGFFDTQIALPALNPHGTPGLGYFVEVEDPIHATVGAASVTVLPGITNLMNIRLLGRGALRVTVLNNSGVPVSGASLGYEQAGYPRERLLLGAGPSTGPGGQAVFANLYEGAYGVSTRIVSGTSALEGRGGVVVEAGRTNDITLRLGPTGTLEGVFVRRDGITPIGFAQIAVGALGFATSDSNGFFRVTGVPLGTHRLSSHDPVTGIGATLSTVLSFNGQTNFVQLIEQARGEIRGAVIASDGSSLLPGAEVTLSVPDGITPTRTVTTGPDGRFSFPGAPAGAFELSARHPVSGLPGVKHAVLPENAAFFEVNVALQPLAAVTVVVLRPDGITPALNTSVALTGGATEILSADTDINGRVTFSDLSLGDYTLIATSLTLTETHSVARTHVVLSGPGRAPDVEVRLAGVGQVGGQVFLSNGATPAAGAEVTLSHLGEFARYTITATADSSGRFAISNVAVGPYEITARSGPLGARAAGGIAFDGEADTLSLTLEPSAALRGRLVRADGLTPVSGEDVTLTLPGRPLPGSLFRTGDNGRFEFGALPLGVFRLQSTALLFNGIALREGALTVNGQTNDVGDLVMDEEDPRVVDVTPPDTAVGVPITSAVELVFNEALSSNTVDTTGVYLQGPANTVAAALALLTDTNGVPCIVRLTPEAPLRSLTTYRVVVVDDVREDAFGAIIGQGPRDLVGRPLVAPFLSTFTTADNDPPVLLSLFPTNGQIQIDPRAVMRLAFNEPIRDTNFSLSLRHSGGNVVPGTAGVGLNGLVLTFAPAAPLAVNATYTLAVSNVFDLAGNRATNEPFVAEFSTLDTLGPGIASLTIASNRTPVAGSTLWIEARLVENEPGAGVRFTQNLNPLGSATNAPFQVSATLPSAGSTTVRAIATDRFGNDGPLAELVINVVSNQPPTVTLTRVDPPAGPVFRGEPFTVRVSADDDAGVTNVAVTFTGAGTLATNVPTGNPTEVTFVTPANAVPGSTLTVRARASDFAGLLSSEATLSLIVSNLNHRPVAGLVQFGPGGAVQLDGVDDQIFSPLFSDVTNDFTMELWVNPTASHRITSEANSGGEAQGGMRYAIYPRHGDGLGGGNHAGAGISVGTNGVSVAEHAAFYIPTLLVYQGPVTGWTHVAVVYQARRPTLYINGTPVRQGLTSLRDVHPSSGSSEFPPYGDYQGQIDEVRVWRVARTASEIRDTMNQHLVGGEPGLAACYHFNETNTVEVSNAVAGGGSMTLANPPSQPLRVASSAPVGGGLITTNTSAALLAIVMAGSDPDGDPLTARITSLPSHGRLFQTADGVTPGAAITNAGATVSNPGRIVLFHRQAGYTGSDEFRYALNDGLTDSFEAFVRLELTTPPGLDTDGDGMPDAYEFANGLNPELNDAGLDPDNDGLTNLAEFLAGTDPQNPDTDGDGLPDGSDGDPLVPSGQTGFAITTYANVIDPVQLTFAPDGTLFAGRDNSGSSGDPNAAGEAVKIHRIAPGGAPVTEYGNAAIPDPDGVGFDAAGVVSGVPGSVLVAGRGGSEGFIRAIQPDQSISVVFGPSSNFDNPQTLKFDRGGRLLFIEPDSGGQMGVWAGTGGAPTLLIPLASPQHFAVGADNGIFVSDGAGVLRHYAPDGTLLNGSLATGLAGFYFDAAPGGFFGTHLWGVDATGRLLEVNRVTGAVTERAAGPGAVHYDAVFGPDGALYLADFENDRVRRVAPVFSTHDVWDVSRGTVITSSSGAGPGPLENMFGGALASPESGVAFFRDDRAAGFVHFVEWRAPSPIRLTGFHLGAVDDSITSRGDRGFTEFRLYARDLATGIMNPIYTLVPGNPYPTGLGPLMGYSGAEGAIDHVGSVTPVVAREFRAEFVQFAPGSGPGPRIIELDGFGEPVSGLDCVPLPAGAVAWWPAEDSFADIVGGLHGSPAGGMTFTSGHVGRAFNFDGMDDYLDLGNPPSLQPAGGSFTLTGWFLIPDLPDNAGTLCVARYPILGFAWGYHVQVDAQRRLDFQKYVAFDQSVSVASPGVITTNTFHHFAAVHTPSEMSVYVDGQLAGTAPITNGNVFYQPGDTLKLGARDCGPARFMFRGRIDEVAIHSRALTAAEVQAQFNAGSLGNCPPVCAPLPAGAVAWWPLEGANAVDIVGTHDAVPQGSPTVVPGRVGQALRFRQPGDFLEILNAPALNPAAITVEAWVNPESIQQGSRILSKDASIDDCVDPFVVYSLDLRADRGNRAVFFFTLADGVLREVAGTSSIPTNVFTHVAATFDGSVARLFVNGTLENSLGVSGPLAISAAPVVIGGSGPACRASFPLHTQFLGVIDEASIYPRALSEAEIRGIAAAGSLGKCPPVCLPLPAGAIAWWPGNNNANDVIGGLPGSLQNGAGFTNSGYVGAAFRLDGVDDRVALANTRLGPLDLTGNQLTVAAWVHLASTNQPFGQSQTIFDKYFNGSVNGYLLGVFGDRPGLNLATVSNPDFILRSTFPIAAGQWSHMAATYDGTSARLFLDGAQVGIAPLTGAILHCDLDAAIGNDNGGSTQFGFNGFIDEVLVLNRALGAGEIAAIVAAGSAGICAPAVSSAVIPPVELRLESGIRLAPAAEGMAGSAPQVVLNWSGPVRAVFALEASLDLIDWFAVPAFIQEIAPGRYEAWVEMPEEPVCFFRVGLAPP